MLYVEGQPWYTKWEKLVGENFNKKKSYLNVNSIYSYTAYEYRKNERMYFQLLTVVIQRHGKIFVLLDYFKDYFKVFTKIK